MLHEPVREVGAGFHGQSLPDTGALFVFLCSGLQCGAERGRGYFDGVAGDFVPPDADQHGKPGDLVSCFFRLAALLDQLRSLHDQRMVGVDAPRVIVHQKIGGSLDGDALLHVVWGFRGFRDCTVLPDSGSAGVMRRMMRGLVRDVRV